MIICGIETSCDDTSIGFVKNGKEILSNVIFSQNYAHNHFSGVVPEIASREHLKNIDKVYIEALNKANINEKDIDIIGVTSYPGLIGSLVIGVNFAKGLSFKLKKPLIPVNHLIAHIYSAFLFQEFNFPVLALLISGGHTAILKMKNFIDFEILGKTFDDSVGEAFDKIAKHFELGYPGGPIIDKISTFGNPETYNFPLTLNEDKYNLNFSFSGLKTAVIYFRNKYINKDSNFSNVNNLLLNDDKLNNSIKESLLKYINHQNYLRKKGILNDNENLFDIISSFQNTVIKILINKLDLALNIYNDINTIIVAGGVSANSYLRNKLQEFCKSKNKKLIIPPLSLCTDNGAMVAGITYEYYKILKDNNFLFFNDLKINFNACAKIEELKRGSF